MMASMAHNFFDYKACFGIMVVPYHLVQASNK
jgi:hypothetical protein